MKKPIMDDVEVEEEITRLLSSDYVKLAKMEERFRAKRRNYMYQLRSLERKGQVLADRGFTLENIAEQMLE